ncbi:hypothetical protein OH76DRAFT_1483684 [Lentinus brumalis]|uniref:C2H2-type domain-containing protein n=1 Tax=Lentinus brumalis TaxID=2498619 RepID=A0A371D7Q3_9APHY|nr:hypothetical protein OH76DRAFT_1483684 [Polyporus brumalis]
MDRHAGAIWACSWNWCPETFRQKTDLLTHLHGTHFNNILKVKKRDWDTYLRSTEGRNGATDSLLDVNLTYPSTSSNESPVNTGGSGSSASSRQRSPPPATPPPLPRNMPSSRSHSSHTPPHPNPSPMLPPASVSSSQRGPSPAKKRKASFASYNAQSSPMSTPSVSSVPPSPALSSMIADAINRAGQINQQSPHNPHSAAGRFAAAGMQGPPRVLPRRTSMGTSPSPLSQSSRPVPAAPHPVFPVRQGVKSITPKSPGAASAGSAQAVEDALTQNLDSKSSSSSLSRTSSSANPSQPASQVSASALHKSSQVSDVQQSYCGSHAVESFADSPSLPQVHVEVPAEPDLVESQPAAPLPLPRTRRALSRASADSQPSQAPVAITRTLRSRSKTPAPAPPPTIPLPRRTNRSRASSASNANAQPRAGSKPPSTRRAGSKQPPSKAQSGTTSTQGLPALDEHPEEERAVADAGGAGAALASQQPAFRSGKLQLPRRTRTAPHAHAQSQAQSQPETQSQTQVSRSRSDVPVSVKAEPEDADAMNIDPPSQTAPSQSQEAGGYREGYGFDLGGIQLMTQRPYPSQSQDWSQ